MNCQWLCIVLHVLWLAGIPLHMLLFPKLWTEMHETENVDRNFLRLLLNQPLLTDYLAATLLDERARQQVGVRRQSLLEGHNSVELSPVG